MKRKIFVFFIIILFLLTSICFGTEDLTDEFLSDEEFEQTVQASNSASEIPNINSRHAVIYDRSSATILYGKEENEQCKMASTTKIMTSLIVIEKANLTDIVEISKKAAGTGGSRLGISFNDKITVKDLLYGLMLCSGNDAAVALAEYVGGTVEGFSELMNSKARELNLKSTHFVTPHGLDNDEHYTTAFELACLTDYALKNETFAQIVKTKTYSITINGYPKTISNTNELLGNLDGIYGVKTGFTNGANRCLVTACKRDNLDIICVVLGCDTKKDRTQDSIKLINYAFKNFSIVNVKDIVYNNFNNWFLAHKNSFIVNKGISSDLELKLYESDFPYNTLAVDNSKIDMISTDVSFVSYYEAPLANNSVIGQISFLVNGVCYFSVDIVTCNSIAKKSIFDYLLFFIENYCSILTNCF